MIDPPFLNRMCLIPYFFFILQVISNRSLNWSCHTAWVYSYFSQFMGDWLVGCFVLRRINPFGSFNAELNFKQFSFCLQTVKCPNSSISNNSDIDQLSRAFANGPEDWGSIPGWVILKTQKMILDSALLNTQHYKVRIKSNMEQSWG